LTRWAEAKARRAKKARKSRAARGAFLPGCGERRRACVLFGEEEVEGDEMSEREREKKERKSDDERHR
jgi:hypothetical protein